MTLYKNWLVNVKKNWFKAATVVGAISFISKRKPKQVFYSNVFTTNHIF